MLRLLLSGPSIVIIYDFLARKKHTEVVIVERFVTIISLKIVVEISIVTGTDVVEK